jgi:hypothetical protein
MEKTMHTYIKTSENRFEIGHYKSVPRNWGSGQVASEDKFVVMKTVESEIDAVVWVNRLNGGDL